MSIAGREHQDLAAVSRGEHVEVQRRLDRNRRAAGGSVRPSAVVMTNQSFDVDDVTAPGPTSGYVDTWGFQPGGFFPEAPDSEPVRP